MSRLVAPLVVVVTLFATAPALAQSTDFGDAPDTYGTTVAAGGPSHDVVLGFSLGATEDSELDGQPLPGATGDGADEDGVTFPNGGVLTACSSVNVTVSLTNTAGSATPRLDAWIDFDGDGVFDDPQDRIATSLALVAGANSVALNVPCDARSAATYARFRLSSSGVSGPGGAASDGEIEDWALTLLGLDFGDAPDPTYPTLLASNGARHAVLPTGNPTLGTLVDTEPNGQPNSGATGDDVNSSDDEDGVVFPATLIPGAEGTIHLTTGATGGLVSCWIDFDLNGSWGDAGEAVVADLPLAAMTTAAPTFSVPVGSPAGNAPCRCRISSQAGLGVTGAAPDGEVEDHVAPVGVEYPLLGVAKRLLGAERQSGTHYRVAFEIRLENLGNVPLHAVQATDDLAVAFPGVTSTALVSLTSGDIAVNPAYDGIGNVLLVDAGQSLPIGTTAVLTLVLNIDSGGRQGPFYNHATGSGVSPATQTVNDLSTDGSDPDPDANGDPGTDGESTRIDLRLNAVEIPTLGPAALVLLAGLLVWTAFVRLKPRRCRGA